MELSPIVYKHIVRPDWLIGFYKKNVFRNMFDFQGKIVLDFGSGVGTNCKMFDHSQYIGVDCNEKRIIYAKKLYSDYQFRLIENGSAIPLEDNSVDYILIVSVLHHIHPKELILYLHEFRRILRINGKIIILEPCFMKHSYINNFFMKLVDRGKYIQHWNDYLNVFSGNHYAVEILHMYQQFKLYNKILFTAVPR